MAIKVKQNKRYGPEGGTRRLHQWGRIRIDGRNKSFGFARYDTSLKIKNINAKSNENALNVTCRDACRPANVVNAAMAA